jgi:hypothetical protein
MQATPDEWIDGNLCHVRLTYQPPVSGIFLSEQTSHEQPANNTFLSKQISISHQQPAKRRGCLLPNSPPFTCHVETPALGGAGWAMAVGPRSWGPKTIY